MRIGLAFALLSLGACAGGPKMADLEQQCGFNDKPFSIFWECQKPRVRAEYKIAHEDLKAGYLATGDVLAERVSAGQMTTAEARLALVQYAQQARSMSDERSARALAAYGAMKAASAPAQAAPAIPWPRPAVICNTYGNQTICN